MIQSVCSIRVAIVDRDFVDRIYKPPVLIIGQLFRSMVLLHCREVSFKKGTMIKLTATVDSNWLEGEVDGIKGIFPRSYVEVRNKTSI